MAECANPLLLTWVSEWLETARQRNSKGVTVYKKAYDSLKACPLSFTHPSEAQQLSGFGPKLCERLSSRLKEHCEEHGLPSPKMPHRNRKSSKEVEDDECEGLRPKKKTRKPKPYVPALRSGAYGLILALSSLDEHESAGITKQQTIELAQPHTDSSFSAPSDPTKFYTAWSSMKTLIEKDLVYERGRPLRKYALTEEGWEVSKRIRQSHDPSRGRLDTFKRAEIVTTQDGDNTSGVAVNEDENIHESVSENDTAKIMVQLAAIQRLLERGGQSATTSAQCEEQVASIRQSLAAQVPRSQTQISEVSGLPRPNKLPDSLPQGKAFSSTLSLPTFTPLTLPPGSFTVNMVLDVREVRAKQDRDYMQNNLATKGCTPIMRSLELGDILWVAKVHDATLLEKMGAEGDEVLLDWVVERKRLDDLVSSIKDGRFHEQKFRLQKSGIKQVIYLIEEISMNADYSEKYQEMVESAIASTQVVNGYFVKKTKDMDETIRYLASLTKLLKSHYEEKPLKIIPTKIITTQNFLPLLENLKKSEPEENYHITYSTFASLSSKSESLTLRDVYLKMLMCTRGVTGEKALEIQQRWKTPNELIDAYRACERSQNKEEDKKRKLELVSGQMSSLVGRKKIQKALSAKIAGVWGE